MERNLLQKDVAKLLNVTEDCITNWENERCEPHISYSPAIIDFLGYNPLSNTGGTIADQVKEYRHRHGLSCKKMGLLLDVNGSTISSWEKNITIPHKRFKIILTKLLQK